LSEENIMRVHLAVFIALSVVATTLPVKADTIDLECTGRLEGHWKLDVSNRTLEITPHLGKSDVWREGAGTDKDGCVYRGWLKIESGTYRFIRNYDEQKCADGELIYNEDPKDHSPIDSEIWLDRINGNYRIMGGSVAGHCEKGSASPKF
jgi:hypothetical protein